MDSETLKKIDLEHLWHPFTQAKVWLEESDPLIVERAEGMELVDVSGRRYLDGVSSLWCNVHGHGNPELVAALKDQAEKLCHSTLLGISHRPILELTSRLAKIVPAGLTRFFYSDSGSAAVEAALRICLELRQKSGFAADRKRTRLLSLETSYHGDTLGAVGVGYHEMFHRSLGAVVVPALRIPPPHVFRFFENLSPADAEAESLARLRAVFEKSSSEIAAMIIEPLVQGAAGMWLHSPEFLRETVELCRAHDVLVIADEVATGFGKTGTMFAVEQAGVTPDILVMAKGLTAGLLPMSVLAAREEIFEGFYGDPSELKTFFFGQTFGGNPLAARVAAASLDLFEKTRILEELPRRVAAFGAALDELVSPLAHVDEIRRLGVMTGIELTASPGKRDPYPIEALAGARIVREARQLGAIIRPLGNTLVLMPPLAMEEKDLFRLVEITAESIKRALGER